MNILRAVDLFCGVGGLTYGLQKSGIKVSAGVDSDVTCKYAYEHNNNSTFIGEDIRNVQGKDLEKFYGKNDVKILVGCAPCQTFSAHSIKARKKKDLTKDCRWNLLKDFSRLIQEVGPEVVSMENVPLLQKQKVFEDFVRNLKKLGFFVSYEIVDCSLYGIPQKRRRLVLLASRIGKISLREPKRSVRKRKVKDVIGGVECISAGERSEKDFLHQAASLNKDNFKRIQKSKPGGTWRDWPEDLRTDCHRKKTGSTYSAVYGRMEWDKPSPTITTQFYRYGTGRFGHPEEDRALSLREGALLQTFPKKYDFVEDKTNFSMVRVGVHIGNAVPPKLGEIIGETIKNHVKTI